MINSPNGQSFKTVTLLLILGSSLIHNAESRNILSVEFFGTKSHVITYLPLLEELARKGDKVRSGWHGIEI